MCELPNLSRDERAYFLTYRDKAIFAKQEMDEYRLQRDSRKAAHFDIIRAKLRDIGDSRDHAYLFAQCMEAIHMSENRILDAYQQFCALDATYGRHAKFADLTPADQQTVLKMMM